MAPESRGGSKRQVPGPSIGGLRIGDARGRSCGEGTAIGGALALGQRRCMQAKQRSGCGRLGCVRRVVHIAEWAHSRVKRADACALLALGCWVCCAGGGRGGAVGAGQHSHCIHGVYSVTVTDVGSTGFSALHVMI